MYNRANKIIIRNKTAPDEMITEENKLLMKEPNGDWQSQSDNIRWVCLYKELENQTLKYNISNSANKNEEKELFIQTKKKIEKEIEKHVISYKEMLNVIILQKKETVLQKMYTFFTGRPNNCIIKLQEYNRLADELDNLLYLMYEINIQLPFYN